MTARPMRRPASIEEMLDRIHEFRTPAALAAGTGLYARPDDVFIATYSKSGTTWLQQIVHGLRSGGSMDFDEISGVVPWLESAVDMGIDPAAEQLWTPRAFKSHLMWRDLPQGGRYITAFRDPLSVLPSFYRFFEGWWFEPGTVTLDEFALQFYIPGSASGRHWDHFVDWWPQIGRPEVLALVYEDMTQNADAVVGVVADFLGLEIEAETMDRVVAQSRRSYMAANPERFDEHLMRSARDRVWGLPPGGDAAKVHSRKAELQPSPVVKDSLRNVWRQNVEPALGFPDYESMRAAMPNPLAVSR